MISKTPIPREQQTNILKTRLKQTKLELKILANITKHNSKQSQYTQHN